MTVSTVTNTNNIMKATICVFIILILNTNLYCQKSKNRLGNKYHQGIDYYLSPDTIDFNREILFISLPSFKSPEYSVALEKKKGKSILKLRSFKSNYWELVFSKPFRDTVMVQSKTDNFAVNITNAFADKLISLFQIVLPDDPALNSIKPDVYDGTTYYISNKKYKREVLENNFSAHRNYCNLIVLLESLANDLRNGDFNEIRYLNQIDKTLTTDKK
jgi:hypothetical protein